MNNNVVKFPERQKDLCCECDREATQTIRLVDMDSGGLGGRKMFCDAHAPNITIPESR